MSSVGVLEVAKYFIDKNGGLMSAIKVQKLCYFAQGWYMQQNNGKKLFDEKFMSWRYGPVNKELYNIHKGKNSILSSDLEGSIINDKNVMEFLDKIYNFYKNKTGFDLGEASHEHRAWIQAGGGTKKWEESNMDDSLIYEDFKKIYSNSIQYS